jgi:type VI secretion system Hcp family effector
MANTVSVSFVINGKTLLHEIIPSKGDPYSSILEFQHQVLYLGQDSFFWQNPIRVHKPLTFLMPLEKSIPDLLRALAKGEHVEKVTIQWYQYNDKTKKEEIYFSHLFEKVLLEKVAIILPDVKDKGFEYYNHFANISFRYKRVTWTYTKGNLIYSDEWQNSSEEESSNSNNQEQALTDQPDTEVETPPAEEKKKETKVTLSEARFHPVENKTDFKGKCKVSVKIDYSEKLTKKKILFKLFSIYKNKIQDMHHEIEASESGNKAETEITLFYNDDYFADTKRTPDAKVEYFLKVCHSEAAEIESEHLKLPYKEPLKCQFIEIPDILFNHNSSVPLIGDSEQLIDAIIGVYSFSKSNPDKTFAVYGHTDTSGDSSYNMQLSDWRAKSIKSLIDKDRKAFVSSVTQKDKIEDLQGYLKYFSTLFSWDCDPGKIDNMDGPKMQQAVKNFQAEYNEHYEKSIAIDGKMGAEVWGAIFDITWQHIALRTSEYCQSGNPPKLNYASPGMLACGEKFPKDGKGKDNYKSKSNRRVELVFAAKEIKIYQEPQKTDPKSEPPQEIVLEPIVIKGDPPKIKAIKYWCSHTKEDKGQTILRSAKNGEVLEITPDMIKGDKITFKASDDNKNAVIKWALAGYHKDTLEGMQVSSSVSGFKSQIEDFFKRLIMGDIKNFTPPKYIQVAASDETGKVIYGKLAVYPNTKKTYELDLSKITKKFKTLKERFSDTFDKFGVEIEFNVLVGKISASGNFAEDETSRFVYFAFEVSGGFSPLIGVSIKKEFPLDGYLAVIPKAIKKYVYAINAVLTLKGQLDTKITVARTGVKKYKANGGLSGSIGAGVGLSAEIGNGKILEVKAMISSGITGKTSVFAENQNFEKWTIGFSGFEIEWDGLKGELSWELFDGVFGSNHEITLIEPGKIWKTDEKIFLE